MYTLTVQNKYGEYLELTHNAAYTISDIVGIDPPDATINVTKNAGADGSTYNSAYVNERQITITLVVNAPAEKNRIALYQFFKPKFPLTLYYSNGQRDVYINGYVQNFSVGYFDKKQTIQIVINCPQPYFNGYYNDIQEFTSVNNLFEFPFSIAEEGVEFSSLDLYVEKSILNNGDVETGAQINIKALGTIDTPKIYNVETGESMIINTTMQSGDEIIINTRRGEKAITLIHNGVKTGIVGLLEDGSTWFVFDPGDNVFTIAAESGVEYMFVTFSVIDQYEGV